MSLQLSFSSMAGIWLVSGRIYRAARERIENGKYSSRGIVRRVLLSLAASAATGLGALVLSAPLAAAHFGFFSVVSPISNLLCLWMVSILYIGGYAVLPLGALFPAAGTAAAGILAWGVRYIYAVTRLLRFLPCESVYMSNPVFAAWLIFVYVVFLLAWFFRSRQGGFRPIVPVCLSLLTLYILSGAVQLSWSRELRVTVLDVGQGESVVLTCGPRTVLVDCGGSAVTHDAGETAVRFLGGQRRQHLDALVLTHLHSDHVNGASRVLAQLKVDTLYMPMEDDEDGYLPEILAAARASGTRVEYVEENQTIHAGDLDLTLFAPQLPGGMNENCLMILAAQDDFEALITGDCPSEAEMLLTGRYELPDIELLVAGHHGSKTSTCVQLLEETKPDLAVISVGYNNYGHPSREVLSRLQDYNIPVLRTDQDGSVTVRSGRR